MTTNGELTRGERLQIMLAPDELEALDSFRFKQRMPSSGGGGARIASTWPRGRGHRGGRGRN